MQHAVFRKILAVLFGLVLAATGLWASPAGEEEPAAAMEKEAVTDPTTGKMVTAPEYGGTLTTAYTLIGETADPFVTGHYAGFLIVGVNERLAQGDWGADRAEFDFVSPQVPPSFFAGVLAESWDTPDPLTYVFHIRQGVHFALDPDSEASRLVGGRELTADDVVFTYQRNLALGEFTDRPEQSRVLINLPWESIEATDKYTVVMKLKEPSLSALGAILDEPYHWILPREVIEQYGDYTDWRNAVGTGPFMLTDYAEGVSRTYTRNPDYWGSDEKYPENRLPYVDQLRALFMEEEATRLAALRSGKLDLLTHATPVRSMDVVRNLQQTNPEVELHAYFARAFQVFGLNLRNAPFDDVRVRHALQMALDLETINDTYYGGFADWKDARWNGQFGYYTPFDEWPAELKRYYTFDPDGAEQLLDDAGYPRGSDGVRFAVEYSHRDVIDLGYTEITSSYWADIGVEVTTRILDTGTWVAARSDHTYEMITGDMAMTGSITTTAHSHDNLHVREYLVCSPPCGIDTSVLDAAAGAFAAATTVDEQIEASKAYNMNVLEQHNQIWGPLAPGFQLNQPWVKGFNGEFSLGDMQYQTILARLWIDQDLKREMGF